MRCARRSSVLSYVIAPMCCALLLAGIFSVVWLRSNIISLEYRISELERQRLDALRETKTTMAEIASLLSFQKAGKTAVAQLGLVFPDRTKVVYVRNGKSGPLKASLDESRRRSREQKEMSGHQGSGGGTL